jgi:superfamily I DNA/RNA helicase
LVDEVQDSNFVQHSVLDLMSEHIDRDSKDKSIWMVGDEIQAIYQFRGGRPELFTNLHKKEGEKGWTTRVISTNYRCEPEIVEAANKLKSHNDIKIEMEAKPKPDKVRGTGSIIVDTPEDNVEAAIQTIGRFAKSIQEEDAKLEEFAVLSRTNAELNDFETACIINELPYVRRGGKGFLDAPESKAVLGYLGLASGGDYKRTQSALVSVLMKPNRGTYIGAEDTEKAVKEAIYELARSLRLDTSAVDPALLLERQYRYILINQLQVTRRPTYLRLAKGDARKAQWIASKDVQKLDANLASIMPEVRSIQAFIASGETTENLLDHILDNVSSTVVTWDSATKQNVETTTTLRQQITEDISIFSDDEDEDEEDETDEPELTEEGDVIQKKKDVERKGLGAVQFLYQLAKPNANDFAYSTDPSSAQGFSDKIARYSRLSETLRIDMKKWKEEQKKLDPKLRELKPKAVTLSTVHSVKGREWKNVTVLMPAGKFPLIPKPRADEPPIDPVEMEELLTAERNLGYVAITRAEKNLEIICPLKDGMSQFVFEAGLQVGENVSKSGTGNVKTASEDDDAFESDGMRDLSNSSIWKVEN